MFFGKKIKKRHRMTRAEANDIIEKAKTEAPLELEKGDLLAMIIAAFVVFAPVLLAIIGSLVGVWWFIFYVWAG